MAFRVTVDKQGDLSKIRLKMSDFEELIQTAAGNLAKLMRSNAPKKTGALRQGIIPSPTAEKTSTPNKVVYDVYWDSGMDSTFVKVTKSGARYYYPASQEYGFRTKSHRIGGKYFMSRSLVAYVPVLDKDIQRLAEEALK